MKSQTRKSSRKPSRKAAAEPVVPDYVYYWEKRKDPKTPAEIKKFFASKEIETLKKRMCDMGRRMWDRQFTDGNGGNITVRVGENLLLCTPTLISKGFMTPEDICLVDMEGRQLAGWRKRTSEVMTHIAIMKRQPKARSCCHAHPPHATAFAIARLRPPTCIIPEAEIFLGVIGMAQYCTPGSPENAEEVGSVGKDHQCILMQNHGVITWGKDVEDSYWKMENADAYCRTLWIAASLGNKLEPIGTPHVRELIAIRKSLGMEDSREKAPDSKLCDNSYFKPGYAS